MPNLNSSVKFFTGMSSVPMRSACFLFAILVCAAAAFGQNPPNPAPLPGSPDTNLFFGAVPPQAPKGPVVVFFHGLGGTAQDWWSGNDAYQRAYSMGYRTAFMSMSKDNSRNQASWSDNAAVIRSLLPKVTAYYGVQRVFAVTHSKGGLDLQAAILDINTLAQVAGVTMISCPCQGTEIADWAFGPGANVAGPLGLLNPGVFSLRLATVAQLRAQVDPVLRAANLPLFTLSGTTFTGGAITAVTGPILSSLVPNTLNDGLVTLPNSRLDPNISVDLGQISANHFQMIQGRTSWTAVSTNLNGTQELFSSSFRRLFMNGFGDPSNQWSWSMQWFRNKLYMGTGREVNCSTLAASDVQQGGNQYPGDPQNNCPANPQDLRLQAEIWEYDPVAKTLIRRFQSPNSIPIAWDANGNPIKFTARDVGFRGIVTFTESDGTQALYVAGVTSSSWNDYLSQYQNGSFPPPRILRSVDGINFTPLPQDPGTFLGDIYKNSRGTSNPVRGFRSMQVYKGQLVVTATDYRGVGYLIGSRNPSTGNNSWYQVSPGTDLFPTWTLTQFNGFLYAIGGNRENNNGYTVYKTDGSTSIGNIYKFTPVVLNAAYGTGNNRGKNALSGAEFNGQLYVGTDRATEMIRINPDDSWDLVVGAPRQTPSGMKYPISGIGQSFDNTFIGHFWHMAVNQSWLQLGTWEWSVTLRTIGILDPFMRPQYGVDFMRTQDGVYWTAATRNGFGDPLDYGIRTQQATPFGFFVGGGRPTGGYKIWLDQTMLDFNRDGIIDQLDVNTISAAVGQAAQPNDNRDMDRDGRITANDATLLATQCNFPNCASSRSGVPRVVVPKPATPQRVQSVSGQITANQVVLSWDPVPGAVRYHVFRITQQNATDFFPANLVIPFNGQLYTIQDIINGKLDAACAAAPTNAICGFVSLVQLLNGLPSGFPSAPSEVAQTSTNAYTETQPTPYQSIYWVRAEDSSGNLSDVSNAAGGPSLAAPPSPAAIRKTVEDLTRDGKLDPQTSVALLSAVDSAVKGDPGDGEGSIVTRLAAGELAGARSRGSDEGALNRALAGLGEVTRAKRLVTEGLLPPSVLEQ